MIEGLHTDVLASPKWKGSSFLFEWIPSLCCKEYVCAKTIFEWRQTCHAILPVPETKPALRQIHLIYYIQHKDYSCSRSTHIFQYVEMAKCFHFWFNSFWGNSWKYIPGKTKVSRTNVDVPRYICTNQHFMSWNLLLVCVWEPQCTCYQVTLVIQHHQIIPTSGCFGTILHICFQLISGFGRTKEWFRYIDAKIIIRLINLLFSKALNTSQGFW